MQSPKCLVSPVPFLDSSAIYRWKSKTANPGISSSSGSRIVSAILNDTERTQLATKRSQSFDLPWTTPAVGQILVSFNLKKVNSTRAIHSATFSLTLIRLGKKPLFPPGLQHTNKTWSRPKRTCPLAPNLFSVHAGSLFAGYVSCPVVNF